MSMRKNHKEALKKPSSSEELCELDKKLGRIEELFSSDFSLFKKHFSSFVQYFSSIEKPIGFVQPPEGFEVEDESKRVIIKEKDLQVLLEEQREDSTVVYFIKEKEVPAAYALDPHSRFLLRKYLKKEEEYWLKEHKLRKDSLIMDEKQKLALFKKITDRITALQKELELQSAIPLEKKQSPQKKSSIEQPKPKSKEKPNSIITPEKKPPQNNLFIFKQPKSNSKEKKIPPIPSVQKKLPQESPAAAFKETKPIQIEGTHLPSLFLCILNSKSNQAHTIQIGALTLKVSYSQSQKDAILIECLKDGKLMGDLSMQISIETAKLLSQAQDNQALIHMLNQKGGKVFPEIAKQINAELQQLSEKSQKVLRVT